MIHVKKVIDAFGTALLARTSYEIELQMAKGLLDLANEEELDELYKKAIRNNMITLISLIEHKRKKK